MMMEKEGFFDSSSEDSYESILTAHSNKVKSVPYTNFKKIADQLKNDEEYKIPECGNKYNGNLEHSHLLYKKIRNEINIKMAENFIDLENEKELYSCDSGHIGIIYISYKFVKIRYTVFQREIGAKNVKIE